MTKTVVQAVRRPLSLVAFGGLAFLVLLLAACGSTAATPASSGSSSASSGSSSSGGMNSGSANSGGMNSGSANPDSANPGSMGKSSVMTISIKESHGTSGDVYTFDPARITVKQGDTITIENLSDELQDIDQGDAVKAGVDVVIPLNKSGTMTFKNAGTFTLKSEKGATLTVTVQ
jgi:plastocyanin